MRLAIDAPYVNSKALLLQVVSGANRCRAVWFKGAGFPTVVRVPTDLRAVDVLFSSLVVQATTAMVREGTRRYSGGGSRTRSLRQAFLSSYTDRIGERLRGATNAAVQRAATETGPDGTICCRCRRTAAGRPTTRWPVCSPGRPSTRSGASWAGKAWPPDGWRPTVPTSPGPPKSTRPSVTDPAHSWGSGQPPAAPNLLALVGRRRNRGTAGPDMPDE
ncbi:hypothetical protein [Actinomadura algeriensis]|uniref:Uncharacterized protein n=1 Tax=Actinomadura algeriensis TaxID=1679523 RepID=A0ABR9JKG4_9ACTN|nr:hypothetical protein [Actinomadura algeriensis]MBE1530881.1 hypothetical protein [Actinomadura algeriensis]